MSDGTTALLQACLQAMKEMQDVSRASIKEMGELRMELAEVKHVSQDMEAILKIVRDGNGRPSLLQRVHDLEQQFSAKAQAYVVSAQSRDKKWDRWVTVSCAVIAALAALYTATH